MHAKACRLSATALVLAGTFAMPLAAGEAQGGDWGGHGGRGSPGLAFAEPSDIVAAEVALNRLAATKGESKARIATAAPGAEVIGPGGAISAPSQFTHPDNLPPERRETREVWMSCDATLAVSHGGWKRGAAAGWYVTVWQRQKKGAYKWVLDQQGAAAAPLDPPDMISAEVGDCPARRSAYARDSNPGGAKRPADAPAPPTTPTDWLSGEAKDHTLAWATTTDADGSRRFSLRFRRAGALREALRIAGGSVDIPPLPVDAPPDVPASRPDAGSAIGL